MAQYIPDNTTAYEADLDNLVQVTKGNFIQSGLAVTAQSSPNMTVQVASGVSAFAGITYSVAAVSSLAISAADPTNARIDVVSIAAGGAPIVTTGTPSATAKPPSMPAGSILLCLVSVAAAASNIQNSNISNRRIIPDFSVLSAVTQPNLILNSDFGRRTTFGLAMPEVFADTSGYDTSQGTGTPTVSANILTFGAATNVLAWPKVGFGSFWRDGRWSATFKDSDTTKNYQLQKYIDVNNYVRCYLDGGGNFVLGKVVAGTPTTVSTTGFAPTVNQWYWLELECQGTTYIAKVYATGTTSPGTTKASSTLQATLSGTVSDAGLVAGGLVIVSNNAAAQWGGIATGNGGVYVETWLPESTGTPTFSGTLGGQAIGYDELVDAGPIGSQFALHAYLPATTRGMTLQQYIDTVGAVPRGRISPSTAYTLSAYLKTSGTSVSGGLSAALYWRDNTGAVTGTQPSIADAQETSWTRKIVTATSPAGARTASILWTISGQVGVFWFDLTQLEQGSAATAWRNAPEDGGAPVIWSLPITKDITTTSASSVDVDSRDAAANIFLPRDATVTITWSGIARNTAVGNGVKFTVSVDGADLPTQVMMTSPGISYDEPISFTVVQRLAAGKHRLVLRWLTTAGTAQISGASTANCSFLIAASAGK